MKKSLVLIGLAIALFSPTGLLFGQAVVQFDENGGGNALYLGPQNDPLTGVTTAAYALSTTITPGDLVLSEPLSGQSDLIRFEAVQRFFIPSYTVFIYSLTGDGIDSPADTVATLPALQSNSVTMTEVGPETGPNGLLYTPTTGQPGFDTAANVTAYDITSDPLPVPEASTWIVSSLAATVLVIGLFRR